MSRWRNWLHKAQPSCIDHLLWWIVRFFSLPYCLVVWLRNRLFDLNVLKSFASDLPVVSVGNLSAGGTGKSPAVAWIARWFRQRHVRVAILSRGYGQLEDGRNDEALELELKLPDVPHLQNADRVSSARLAADELEMELLLLDDGFQHRRLRRSLDIVLIDVTDSPAAQWLLPAGLRREPWSALRRADFAILTRVDQVAPTLVDSVKRQVGVHLPAERIVLAIHQPQSLIQFPQRREPLSLLQDRQVLAFCAIGNPGPFFASLVQLGAKLLDTKSFPDHHAYSAKDVEWLMHWNSSASGALLVCTVKDWVKIQESNLGERDLFAVEIEMKIVDGLKELEQALYSIMPYPNGTESASSELDE